jgi:hypothetical protein
MTNMAGDAEFISTGRTKRPEQWPSTWPNDYCDPLSRGARPARQTGPSQTKMEASTADPTLYGTIERIEQMLADYQTAVDRLGSVGDTLFGGVPENSPLNNVRAPDQTVMGRLGDVADRLNSLNRRAHDIATRLHTHI